MSINQVSALALGVRPHVLLRYLGQLALIQAALILAPLAVAIWNADFRIASHYIGLIVFLLIVNSLTRRIISQATLRTLEIYCLVALAFCLSATFMAIPFWLNGLTFIDALFESVSGVTTTGLSTLPSVADRSPTFLFARAWLQWCGGLGIVVFSIALIADHHLARRQFMEGVDRDHLVSETRRYARMMLIVYIWLTISGTLLLWLSIGDGFNAIVLTLSAVSTGGFAPYNDSLLSLHPGSRLLVILISTAGAIALPIYILLWRRHWRQVMQDTEVQVFLGMVVLATIILSLLRMQQFTEPFTTTLQESVLLAFSAQSTTGFASQPLAQLHPAALFIVILSMITGGGLGSTAGGIKIMRMVMLWKALQSSLHRVILPTHAVITCSIGNHKLSEETIRQAVNLILLNLIIIIVSWWPFIYAGYDPLHALFEVVSAIGTVGLSVGISHAELEPGLKAILMFDMLAGRVEVLALIILIYPRTWFARRESS